MTKFAPCCPAPVLGLVSVSFVVWLPALDAQPPARLGTEFQVNAYTTESQRKAALELDADGDFVVAWHSLGQDGSSYGVFARRFSASGVPQATELQVNSYATDSQRYPSVGLDADGDFVVVWESLGQDGQDFGVFARRLDAAGVAQASEFQVNAYTSSSQRYPAVALDADGDFVVAWQSLGQDGSLLGVFARRFDAAGAPQSAEFQVNTYTTNHQGYPVVDLDAEGNFVVAWMSFAQDGSNFGVFAQRFDADGTPQGAEFQVNSFTSSLQRLPAVALDAAGDFVITWQSSQDGSNEGIFAQRFDSSGSSQAAELQVNSYTTGFQLRPAVALDADGGFIVAWESEGQDGSSDGIFARRFDAAGTPQAVELQVNTYTTSDQSRPTVGMDGDGDFVVSWSSSGQDGSYNGVFGQRFAPLAVLEIDGNGTTDALTDGLLILRFLFGFTGATLVSGAVDGVGCTRCDAMSIEAHLATLI